MVSIESLVRENIKLLKPYSSAKDEFTGAASILLDANENSFGSPLPEKYNRYPDPKQGALKVAIGKIKGVTVQNIFLGNGSDEAIDILFRVFCQPLIDNVIICPPTYGMYEVCANINDVGIRRVNLLSDFQLDIPAILQVADNNTKMLFLCSPNNPTGNSLNIDDIVFLIENFNGIVVIDEAYINYSKQPSCIKLLTHYANVVILQTFSKAWGLAALRLGMAFSQQLTIDYMNKVKPPYNINQATQQLALNAVVNINWVNEHIKFTVTEREKLIDSLSQLPTVLHIFQSDANFVLVKVTAPNEIYNWLMQQGIIVRNRSNVELCQGCLRITVGTKLQNEQLLATLQKYKA